MLLYALLERLSYLQEDFVELACVLDVPVLGSSLLVKFIFSKCLEAKENFVIISHFFEVIDAKTRVKVGLEVLAAICKRLELNNFRNFDVLAKSIALVFCKIASISDSERVPADYFDLVNSIIDSVNLLAGLLLV